MGKDLVPTAKEINEAHLFAKECAETAIEWAVKCGRMLKEIKAAVPHGQFEGWIQSHCDFAPRQARKYMEAATKTAQVGRFDSLKQALDWGKPEPKPAKRQDPNSELAANTDRPAASIPSAPAPTAAGSRVAVPSNEGAAPSTTEPEWTAEDEAQFQAEADADSRERIETAMESDDKLAEAYEQIKQQSREIVALKASRDHYMRQANEAVRLLKIEQRKVAKLERQQRAA